MKLVIFALPAVTFLAATAFAQTDTTTGSDTSTGTAATTGANAEMFGTNWPLSVGTTFFTDADTPTLRSTEEITSGWQSLSQEDRDMIVADCKTFMAAHGDAAADASASTTETAGSDGATTATEGTAATDTATTAETTGTASTGTADTGAEAATTAAAGYDLAEMKTICDATAGL